jgi:hypothetical protein
VAGSCIASSGVNPRPGGRPSSSRVRGKGRGFKGWGLLDHVSSRQSLLRLTGALLEEQNDERAVRRRYLSTESMKQALRTVTGGGGAGTARAEELLNCQRNCAERIYTTSRATT